MGEACSDQQCCERNMLKERNYFQLLSYLVIHADPGSSALVSPNFWCRALVAFEVSALNWNCKSLTRIYTTAEASILDYQ